MTMHLNGKMGVESVWSSLNTFWDRLEAGDEINIINIDSKKSDVETMVKAFSFKNGIDLTKWKYTDDSLSIKK